MGQRITLTTKNQIRFYLKKGEVIMFSLPKGEKGYIKEHNEDTLYLVLQKIKTDQYMLPYNKLDQLLDVLGEKAKLYVFPGAVLEFREITPFEKVTKKIKGFLYKLIYKDTHQ